MHLLFAFDIPLQSLVYSSKARDASFLFLYFLSFFSFLLSFFFSFLPFTAFPREQSHLNARNIPFYTLINSDKWYCSSNQMRALFAKIKFIHCLIYGKNVSAYVESLNGIRVCISLSVEFSENKGANARITKIEFPIKRGYPFRFNRQSRSVALLCFPYKQY